MIGVVDYEAGNIASVRNALDANRTAYVVAGDATTLSECEGIILPGVGAAPGAMKSLRAKGLTTFLRECKKPLLGICLGMQLFFDESEEGETQCLGILPGRITKLSDRSMKVPHMGWNEVRFHSHHPLVDTLGESGYYYFAHSFAAPEVASAIGVSDCGGMITAALAYENFLGVQFHPEKSGSNGLSLLKNFEALCRSSRQ